MENTTTFKPFDELVCSDNFMFAKAVHRCTSSFKFTRSGNLAVSLDKLQSVDKTQSETRIQQTHIATSTLKFRPRFTKSFVSAAAIIRT